MLAKDDYLQWAAKVERPPAGMQTINEVRSNPPARTVKGNRSNMSGRFPSKKMGCTIQFESNQGELHQAVECEWDPNVLEYYDQPPVPVYISWTDEKGKRHGQWSTPDYFVLCEDGSAGWIEIKTEEDLQRGLDRGDKYTIANDGSWSCPSAEAFAADQGLFYRIRSHADFNPNVKRNFDYLYDYLLDDETEISSEKKLLITGFIACNQGITLSSLFQKEAIASRDEIFLLIARGELYVDFRKHLLLRHEKTPVFTDYSMSMVIESSLARETEPPFGNTCVIVQEKQPVLYNGGEFLISAVDKSSVRLLNEVRELVLPSEVFTDLVFRGEITSLGNPVLEDDEVAMLLKKKSPKEHDRAQKRMLLIAPYLNGTDRETPSTARRWLRAYHRAELKYGSGYLGLFDRQKKRGNRKKRLPEQVYKLMRQVIETVYETKANMNLDKAYAVYQSRCEEDGVRPASRRTFYGYNATVNKVKQVAKRKGLRAAYQIHITYWYLESDTPRHGDRPFEVVHIDHTELDIEIYDPKTGESFGKPWLTIMIDANTRRILAVYLSFEPPSYRSVMMVIRECVKRFGRIPQNIVVDNGKEFRSRYFAMLCSLYAITVKYRPPREPRFGSVIERIFGTTNTQFIYTLLGNTQLMKDPRGTSSSHLPSNNAVWTFDRFLRRLKQFLYDIYDQIKHPALFETPRSAYEREILQHGLRQARLVVYNKVFVMNTRPAPPKETAKVVPMKGVKINNIYYWCEEFRSRKVEATQVPVKYEPFNIGIAYAYVDEQWVECRSDYYEKLVGVTEHEMQVMSTEIKANKRLMNKKTQYTGKLFRDFLVDTLSEQMELVMARRDAEGRICHDEYSKEFPKELPEKVSGLPQEDGSNSGLNVDPLEIEIFEDL